jgi:hypothetical protein
MRRALPFLAAAIALLVPATARAAPPTCHEFLMENPDTPITAPGQAISLADPCGSGSYTLDVSPGPANGQVTVSGTTLTYTPGAGFHGSDTFFYTATAAGETSAPAEVDVIVDSRPSCADASASVVSGRSVALTAGSCSDPDGDALTVWGDSLPEHGTIARTGPMAFVYTPDAGFVGTDTTLFYAVDEFLASDDALLTITVNALPAATPTPTPTLRDITPPVARLTSAPGQKLKQVLAKGLHLTLASNEAGKATVKVAVDAKTARKLHIKPEVGSASATVAAGRLDLTVKLTAKARKAIKRLRKVRLTVRVVVTDAAGNPATRSLTVTLKR